MHRVYRCLFTVLCAVCLVQPASAELYRWVDENGVTQFSDKPPPGGAAAETVDVRVAPADPAAAKALEARIQRVDSLREARLKQEEEQRLAAEERALREENCRRSRARLASYSVPNALIAQADGSRIRVDEETRQRELAASREMIEKYCG